jgi:spoIIIJ-associated protein
MDREQRLAEVELSRRTVDEAISDGLKELGLTSPDEAEVTVVSEGKAGFLGMGRELAVVVMRPKPKERKRRRRRRRGGDGGRTNATSSSSESGGGKPRSGGSGSREKSQDSKKQQRDGRSDDGRNRRNDRTKPEGTSTKRESQAVNKERPEQADIETQATVSREFLEGLLDAFGLEATVSSRIEDDILLLDVAGEQSEALVGQRGAVLDAVLELTRTVVQRKTFGAPRMRLDIAGYTERRREALRIYAAKLADKVKESGGELMLEPMNPADRKVVHDTIADIDGVRSFSEGEDADRAVVVAPEGD